MELRETAAESSELAPVEPKRGTLEWLRLRPLVEVCGLLVPDCHRIPDGASLAEAEPDTGRCRVIHVDGRGRCGAPRVRGWGICSAHLGGGDPEAASALGHAVKARIKERRTLLGIGPNRVGNPRQAARLAALERSEEIARALVDGPLDDAELGSVERQIAVVRALDATFPLQAMTVEVELPTSGEAVTEMGW